MPFLEQAVGIDRRDLLRGAGVLATIAGLGPLGGCAASAQGDELEAAVAALATLEPLRPENFGASGRAGDDQSRAFAAMIAEARRRGRARIVLREGATYALFNPFLFGGMRELLIDGNGATLMNARVAAKIDTYDANYAPFRSPTPVLPNGVEPLDFGRSQGSGKLDLGVRLRSAAKGATVIASFDGAPLPPGRLLLYGWDRYGLDSVPPCPTCFEWVSGTRLAGRPDQLRLSAPLRFAYDSQAPETVYTNDPVQRYGAARAFLLDRARGRFQAFNELDVLALRDVRFAPSPRIRAPGEVSYNGVAGFGGARSILLERVTARRLFVNFAELVRMRGIRVEQDLEIDKILGRVEISESRIGSLVGAIGAREVSLGAGTVVTGGTSLAPIDSLEARGARFSGDAHSDRALIGFYVHGSAAVRLDDCTFAAVNRQADRLVEGHFFDANARRVARGRLSLSRAEYQRSGIFRNLFVGATLYDPANRAIARVTRLPWCPGGDLVVGDVHLGIEELVPLESPLRLRVPVIAGLTVRNASIVGPHAANVTAMFGSDPRRTGPSILAAVDGLEIGAGSVRFTSDVTAFDRPSHTFLIVLGRSFVPTRFRFEIVRAAANATDPILVGADSDTARDLVMLRAVSPTVTGARLLSSSARTLLAGDVAGDFPPGGISAIRVVDPSRALPAASRARWTLTLEGKFA